jgi:hypothetical membrane protein
VPEVTQVRAAAILWLIAAVAYLSGEALAASAFPHYSYARDYISALGNPVTRDASGMRTGSSLAEVMNAAFAIHGVLFATSGLIAGRSQRGQARAAVLSVASVMHGVGISLVAALHSNASTPGGSLALHTLGAGLAIISGNVAALTSAGVLRGAVPRRVRTAGVLLGTSGLGFLVLLVAGQQAHAASVLGRGVLERGAVYTIIAWELLAGSAVLRQGLRRSARPSTSRTPRGCNDG